MGECNTIQSAYTFAILPKMPIQSIGTLDSIALTHRFVDDKFYWIENIVGKKKIFSKAFLIRVVRSGNYVAKV